MKARDLYKAKKSNLYHYFLVALSSILHYTHQVVMGNATVRTFTIRFRLVLDKK